VIKRFHARAKGRGAKIHKQTCHIYVFVGDEDKKVPAVPRSVRRAAAAAAKA
jgi:hypothetical protein